MDDIVFPPRVELAQRPTPLTPLRRLQAQTGGPLIWLKRDDMSGCTLSGNKVRKLEFILARAIDEGCGAVITCGGLQSNHCRATALAAAQLGLQCHLILRGLQPRGTAPVGNLLLDELAGASIGFHSLKEYFSERDRLFDAQVERYRERGIKALAIPTGGSDGVGAWGYIGAYQELLNDFQQHRISPRYIVTATGSGGTQAGLTLGAAFNQNRHEIIGINVCDDEAYFVKKIGEDIRQWQALYGNKLNSKPDAFSINIIDGYVGEGYAKAGPEIFQTIRNLARLEGVVLDPVYTGKAFTGLLKEIDSGRFAVQSDIVFIHTGGVFGLFPYAEQL